MFCFFVVLHCYPLLLVLLICKLIVRMAFHIVVFPYSTSGIPYGMRKIAFVATYSKFAFMATSGPCGQLKFMSNKANYHRFASRAVFRLPSIKLSYHTSRTAFRRSQMPPNGQGCNSQLPYSREFFMSQLSNPSKRSPRFLLTVSVNSLSLVQNSNSISQQQLYKSRTSPTKNAQYPGRYQHFNLVSTHKKITALASVAKFLVGIPLRLYTLEKKSLDTAPQGERVFFFLNLKIFRYALLHMY